MRGTLKHLFLSWLFLVVYLPLSSQEANPLFYYLISDDGIASDKTTCVYQDHMGFMWVGTEEGLTMLKSYYNISNFIADNNDPTTISNNRINVIYEDRYRQLWIGTENGLNLYQRETNTFKRIMSGESPKQISGEIVTDITEDLNGSLWIATNNGLNEYLRQEDTFKKHFRSKTAGPTTTNYFRTIESDESGRLWIGFHTGLGFLESGKFYESSIVPHACQINDLQFQDGAFLWIGTNGQGAKKVDLSTLNATNYSVAIEPNSLINDYVNKVAIVNEADVWIATRNGLSIIKPGEEVVSHQFDFDNYWSLADYTLLDVFEDNDHGVWIATLSGGLNLYHDSDNRFKYLTATNSSSKTLSDFQVLSLHEDSNHNIWVGSRLGLTQIDVNGAYHHYDNSLADQKNHVLSITSDVHDNLWIGGTGGLSFWSSSTKSFTHYFDLLATELGPDMQINHVFMGHNDQLWLGTDTHGLMRFDTKSRKVIPSVSGELSNPLSQVNTSLQDRDSNTWVGSSSGLYLMEPSGKIKKVQFPRDGDAYTKVWINCLYQDSEGNMWGGTQQEGLFKVAKSDNEFTFFTTEDGLSSNDIKTILEEDEGVLWVSSNRGLSKIEMNNNEEPAITNYTIHDGLQGTQFVARSGVKTNSGRLFFGGLQGLTFFDPGDIKPFKYSLEVHVIDLKLNGETASVDTDGILKKDISLVDSLWLTSDYTDLTFGFVATDFLRPDSVKYRYTMAGYDDGWNYLEDYNTQAIYTNLPRGSFYGFEVQAKSALTDWSDSRPIVIYISPRYYETAWFKGVLIIMGLGFFLLVYRFRAAKEEERSRQLEEIIKRRTAQLNNEIEQRKDREIELELAKKNAEEANKTKSQFLANMSHEMRTPLNGITGLTSVLKEKLNNAEQQKFLKSIEESANSLKSIIGDLLDISKIEAGKLVIQHEEFNLKKLIDETNLRFKPEIEKKGLNLESSIDSSLCKDYIGDYHRIQQVLANLVSNAIKYTDTGEVKIEVKEKSAQSGRTCLYFKVSDTGIGIAKDKVKYIFNNFTQVEQRENVQTEGLGLGLAISQNLVKHMGGELWVDSEPNQGSIFHFTIIVERATENDLGKTPQHESETADNFNGKALIVEDNKLNQMVSAQILKTIGLESDVVDTGEEAIAALERAQYHLVLMDIQMPGMDGYQTAQAIRNAASSGIDKNVPIIAVTAYALEGDREKCLSAGMNDYIPKPLTIEALRPAVNKWYQHTALN